MAPSSSPPTVAIMSPGDMGHHVGALLGRHGVRVITALDGRSTRTKALAAEAGIEDVGDDATLVDAADLLLSIIAPAGAEALATRFVPALEATSGDLVYVDCNAVAPATSARIGAVIEQAGARFVDAGIVGPPPKADSSATRFYASGAAADRLAELNAFGLDVRTIGTQIGDASALKMCYAALNKGTIALMAGVSVMASRLGVDQAFDDEMRTSQEAVRHRMHQQVPGMVPKAHRWIGEMEEIAKTFESTDLTPEIFRGIADLYRFVAARPIAETSPESWREMSLSFDQVTAALASRSD